MKLRRIIRRRIPALMLYVLGPGHAWKRKLTSDILVGVTAEVVLTVFDPEAQKAKRL